MDKYLVKLFQNKFVGNKKSYKKLSEIYFQNMATSKLQGMAVRDCKKNYNKIKNNIILELFDM